MGYLYLLCYERSLSGKGNRHYLGYADSDPDKRIALHRRGKAHAAFTDEAHRQGIAFTVAAIWPDCTKVDERNVKRQKHHTRYCRLCRGDRPTLPVPPNQPVAARTEPTQSQATIAASASYGAAYDDLEDLPY